MVAIDHLMSVITSVGRILALEPSGWVVAFINVVGSEVVPLVSSVVVLAVVPAVILAVDPIPNVVMLSVEFDSSVVIPTVVPFIAVVGAVVGLDAVVTLIVVVSVLVAMAIVVPRVALPVLPTSVVSEIAGPTPWKITNLAHIIC